MVKVHTLTWNLHKRVDFCYVYIFFLYEVTVKPRLTYKQHTYKELSQVKFCNIQLKYWCVANAHNIPPVKGFHPPKEHMNKHFRLDTFITLCTTYNQQPNHYYSSHCMFHSFSKDKVYVLLNSVQGSFTRQIHLSAHTHQLFRDRQGCEWTNCSSYKRCWSLDKLYHHGTIHHKPWFEPFLRPTRDTTLTPIS